MKIVMLGYGNVAAHLVGTFEDHSKTEVIQIFNRSSTKSSGHPEFTTNLDELKEAAQTDIYRFMLLGQTEDSHEAHRAWRERRKPEFKGR